jgi:hypothetical protein
MSTILGPFIEYDTLSPFILIAPSSASRGRGQCVAKWHQTGEPSYGLSFISVAGSAASSLIAESCCGAISTIRASSAPHLNLRICSSASSRVSHSRGAPGPQASFASSASSAFRKSAHRTKPQLRIFLLYIWHATWVKPWGPWRTRPRWPPVTAGRHSSLLLSTPAPESSAVWRKWEVLDALTTEEIEIGHRYDNRLVMAIGAI